MVSIEKIFDRICAKLETGVAYIEKYISAGFVFAFSCLLIAAVIVFQILNITVLPETVFIGADSGLTSGAIEKFQNVASVETEYKENQGMISVSCTGIGSGGVYVYINNTMKANIINSELKNLKVKKGDVVIVKGHGIEGEATVTVNAAVGNINTDIIGYSKKVSNLGVHFLTIS